MDTQLASLIERLAKPCVIPMRSAESRQLAAMKAEVVTCGPYRSRVLVKENHDLQAKSALLLHGWGGHPIMLSETQTLLQARGYRVYMPFLLGHDPQVPASCDLPGQCSLLLAMQATYGPFDSVVAHSAGGIITAMAHWLGFTLDRVALLSSPASLPSLLQHSLAQLQAPEHHCHCLVPITKVAILCLPPCKQHTPTRSAGHACSSCTARRTRGSTLPTPSKSMRNCQIASCI